MMMDQSRFRIKRSNTIDLNVIWVNESYCNHIEMFARINMSMHVQDVPDPGIEIEISRYSA